MSLPLIPTTIIGSLPKPAWLTSEWYSIAERWNLEGAALAEALDDATRLALADQENAGIDIVCDGEQRRPTHYSYFAAQLGGIDCAHMQPKAMRGGKRTQDVPVVRGPLTLANHRTLDDYLFLRKLTTRPIKMTLPGPSTLVDGTCDDYYGDERALALAYADVLNQEIAALAAAGCEMVQLDEPAITRLPEKFLAWGVEAIDRAFAGAATTSCVHVCYGYTKRARGKTQDYIADVHGSDRLADRGTVLDEGRRRCAYRTAISKIGVQCCDQALRYRDNRSLPLFAAAQPQHARS